MQVAAGAAAAALDYRARCHVSEGVCAFSIFSFIGNRSDLVIISSLWPYTDFDVLCTSLKHTHTHARAHTHKSGQQRALSHSWSDVVDGEIYIE